MIGYIGERAKRRRRNFIFLFILLIIILIIYNILPLLKLSDAKPTNNLFPNIEEIISPEINSTIEELELKIFDKEQKIIFRNKQIEKLQDLNKNLSFKIENLEKTISLSSNNQNLINTDQSNNLKKINDTISKLRIENNNLLQEIKDNKDDYIILDKEIKIISSKNIELKNLNELNSNEIKDLVNLTKEQKLIIKLLKDLTPHG